MSNQTANTQTTNLLPVQGTFEPLPPYKCINLIGPAGTPFYAPVNPVLDGVAITNSTIDSTTIGITTPAAAQFTIASQQNQPVANNDLTTKLYVDSLALGISWKQPVTAATTADITLSGAPATVDGVTVQSGERVLVKNQNASEENGIYIVGSGAWARSPDANTWDEMVSALVFVTEGGLAGSAWYCPIQPGGTLGVTAITWNNFSVGGVYFAGTGLSLTGGDTFNIANTGVSAATYGGAAKAVTLAINAQGQITSASDTNIAINANQITSGTIDTARISGSYTGITAVGTLTGLTVSATITGSISGNAATATTATTATSATTATNLAGGATGSVPYQSGAGATSFLGIGSTGQVLTVAGGVPSWSTPTTGTVTSVSGTGTVSGISLSGTVTSSGSLTLGGTLDLSSPPAIGGTTPAAITGTTVTATTKFVGPYFDAASSAGGALRNASGVAQLQWGAGGGNNVTLDVSTNLNGTNAQIDISPTGTGHVHIKPTGSGSLEIAPTSLGTINNMSIGQTTAAAGSFTNLGVSGTISLAGSTGTAGYVLTSNGASAPTWQANANGITIADDTTTNATRYLTFSDLTTGTETTLDVSSTKLTFNPSTGVLSATGFAGSGADLTNLDAGDISTGTLAVARGGTGITSFGAGVATWLGTPSSANLAAAVTDETGTGALVFATSPTLTTPTIGVATATSINKVAITAPATSATLTIADGKTLTASNSITLAGTDGTTMTFPPASASIGYLNIPQNSQSAAYTLVADDSGKHILHPSTDNNARTFTIPANSSVPYAVGTAITFVNMANTLTIAITSDTMYLAGPGTTGSRTLAAYGVATAVKLTSTTWIISGTGLT